MMRPHQDISEWKSKTKPCRNCQEPIELELRPGCFIEEDASRPDWQVCRGFQEGMDFSRDVELEYDNLCAKCYYDKSVPHRPGLCEVLFKGAEPDEDMQAYLDSHPIVASWRKEDV